MMAYIDPTAGGLLLQAVFGGVAAVVVLFWKRLTGLFRRPRNPDPAPAPPPVDPPPPAP